MEKNSSYRGMSQKYSSNQGFFNIECIGNLKGIFFSSRYRKIREIEVRLYSCIVRLIDIIEKQTAEMIAI